MDNNNNIQNKVDTEEKVASRVDIRVDISGDYYSAMLTVASEFEIDRISKNVILEQLEKKGIIYGVDMKKIDFICSQCRPVENIVISKGIPHINGVDGRIEYKVELPNDVKPRVLDDGTVDFKEMNSFVFVKKGQVLAERIPPTEGEEGRTVTGKIIKPKSGKKANFGIGKNVILSEDGSKLISSVDGSISMEGHKINIIEVLELMSDVGVKTGNITFKGKVIVHGNVLTGYSIHCDGDLEIKGVVEAAQIRADGDITISNGIQGHDEANITCGGSLVSKFINNCNVKVDGNIEADSIMHSNIICDGIVKVHGKKGMIVGGSVQAKEEVHVHTLGSSMGTNTRVIIGMDSDMLEKSEKFSGEIKEIKQKIKKVDQILNLLTRKLEINPNDKSSSELLNKTQKSKREYMEQLSKKSNDFREIRESLDEQQGTKIYANAIYPGVRISIGQSHYNVKNAVLNAKVGRYNGEISMTNMSS